MSLNMLLRRGNFLNMAVLLVDWLEGSITLSKVYFICMCLKKLINETSVLIWCWDSGTSADHLKALRAERNEEIQLHAVLQSFRKGQIP